MSIRPFMPVDQTANDSGRVCANASRAGDALVIDGLTVEYGSGNTRLRALDSINLRLPGDPAGASLVLIGASAAGKSSLGMAFLRLLPQNAHMAGSVLLPGGPPAGAGWKAFREYRRTSVGTVFQDAPGSLIPGVPVGRQVQRVFSVRRQLGRRDAERQARSALVEVGFEDVDRVWRAFPCQLSGGMCQRVVISLALAAPRLRVLICDEPTSALDTVSAAQILDLLLRVQREHAAMLSFITHDVRLVGRFDWVAVLSEGKLVEFDRSASFLSGPKSDEGRRLLEASKALSRTAANKTA